MTTNYRRGYAFEQIVRKHMKEKGFIVIRSGGSITPDLVCVAKNKMEFSPHIGDSFDTYGLERGDAVFVECKRKGSNTTQSQRRKLAELHRYAPTFIVIGISAKDLNFREFHI